MFPSFLNCLIQAFCSIGLLGFTERRRGRMLLKRKSFHSISLCLVGVLGLALSSAIAVRPAAAQVLYGSVVGTVTDQSDAVVPNAAVTLTNKETGTTRSAATDAGGRYSFVNVLPGRYDIKVTAKGFRTYAQADLEVAANTV